MAPSKEYLAFILDQLSELDEVSYRPMMGEYVLYYCGRVVGGVYDDRLLLKPTPTALRLMADNAGRLETDVPYEGAKEMLAADVDDPALTCAVIRAIADELPEKRGKRRTDA